MDAENGKMKTEYSPLNNLTSSGEEVEQFSLPITTSLADRPKRRRKRKDFDSLKSHALPALHRGQSMCSCAGCFTAIIICILIASVCGLGAIIYSLSNNITEMQKLIDNLQVARGSVSSELLSVKSKTNGVDEQLKTLALQTQNLSSLIASNSENITKLSDKVKSMVTAHNNEKSSSDTSQEVQQQLAQFGSDITSLKGDVASLKQQSQSNDNRINSIDGSLQSLYLLNPVQKETTTSHPATDERAEQQRLEELVYSVNNTCNSRIGVINQLLQKTDSNFYDYKVAANRSMHTFESNLQTVREDLDSGLLELNTTLHNSPNSPRDDNSSIAEINVLTGRLDQLEAYIREVSLKLDNRLTTQLENNVVNVTMLSGMEDIINRVIDKKLSDQEKPAHNVAAQTAVLEGRIIRLEDNFRALANILHDHEHTTIKPDDAHSAEHGNETETQQDIVLPAQSEAPELNTTETDLTSQVPLQPPITYDPKTEAGKLPLSTDSVSSPSEGDIDAFTTEEPHKNNSKPIDDDALESLLGG